MTQGHIAPGEVRGDIKAITTVEATRFHAFAGIGVWDYALSLAGWPEELPVWTGSCPCQPFSQAGLQRGYDDERHLWPAWFRLIKQHRPAVCFGEQVASPAGRAWLGVVRADLEALGYAVGAADLCAASVGGPHIRQRLYWVAISNDERPQGRAVRLPAGRSQQAPSTHARGCAPVRLAVAPSERRQQGRGLRPSGQPEHVRGGAPVRVEHTDGERGRRNTRELSREEAEAHRQGAQARASDHESEHRSPVGGFWSDAEWIPCADEKQRPIEPGTFPLADGAAQRMGRLRGYGNAIVPQVAAAFIESVLEVLT